MTTANAYPDDVEALKAMLLERDARIGHLEDVVESHKAVNPTTKAEIEHLKLLIAKLRRMQFGRSSEKLDRQIEPPELRLEELEAERRRPHRDSEDAAYRTGTSAAQTAPEHLPREILTYWSESGETCAADRKGVPPQQHLGLFSGTLQADAYGGYQAIYEIGWVAEAACWAYARRQFYELHAARPNALNTEALERIGALYKIEEAFRGKPPDERQAYRQTHSSPLLDQLHAWLSTTLETLSRESDTSRAILYALNWWEALTRYCDDGRLEIDNLPVERALRGAASVRRQPAV